MAASLIPPHGGTLVHRTTADPAALKAEAAKLKKQLEDAGAKVEVK